SGATPATRDPATLANASGVWSRLHDDGDDHRPAPGAIAHEPACRLADMALQGLDVERRRRGGEGVVQRGAHLVLALLEEVLRFGGVDPPAGDDLGPGDDRPRLR